MKFNNKGFFGGFDNYTFYADSPAKTGIGGIDANTVLMLHMDGTNGSQTFTDSEFVPKTVTAVATAQISTTTPKFGTGCGLFNGTTDWLTVPASTDFNWSSGQDFTIDCWFRVTNNTFFCLFSKNSNTDLTLYYTGGAFFYSAGGVDVFSHGATVNTATWYHYACVRASGVATIYLNGSNIGAGTSTATAMTTNIGIFIGERSSGDGQIPGNIDEYRISKVARWTSNFTPPTGPYTT